MATRKASDSNLTGKKYNDASAGASKIVDIVDAPTLGTVTASGLIASIPFTAATTGGVATTFTATSSPGGLTASSATSPITYGAAVLSNGTTYTFTVRGSNAVGNGVNSATSNSVTPTQTEPNPPTGVSAGSANPSSILVSWTAPTFVGTTALVSYDVTVSPGGTTQNTGSTATSYRFTGLSPSTAYTFTVKAKNSSSPTNTSQASSASGSVTTPALASAVYATSTQNYTPAYYPFKYEVYVRGGGASGASGNYFGSATCSPGKSGGWGGSGGAGGQGGATSQATGQTANSGNFTLSVAGAGGSSQFTGANTVNAGPNGGAGGGGAYAQLHHNAYTQQMSLHTGGGSTAGTGGGQGGNASVARVNDWGINGGSASGGSSTLNSNVSGGVGANLGNGGTGGNGESNATSCGQNAVGSSNGGSSGTGGFIRLVPTL